ncbi:TPA: hypothetical protein ACOFC6_003216 [Stenotrophomonas maltophilia]
MIDIEKRARELLAAEVDRDAVAMPGVEEVATSIREGGNGNVLFVPTAIRAITTALLLGRPVDLLDQDGASRIEAQELQVVPSAALGADEAGAVGVDQVSGGLPRNVQLAEVASEHEAGVRLERDGQATADHSAHNLEMVERVAKAMQASEQARSGWTWEDCSPIEVEGWMDLARAAIAALTPPEGYVLVPVIPAYEMVKALAEAAGCNLAQAALAYRDALAARPEVKP